MEFNIDLFSLFNPDMGAELGLPIFLWPIQCQDSRGIVQVIEVNSGLSNNDNSLDMKDALIKQISIPMHVQFGPRWCRVIEKC